MALARLAIISLSCVLFLLFYSSTCVAIPVPPGTNVGNRQTWPGTGHTTPPGKGLSTRAPDDDNTTPAPVEDNTTPAPELDTAAAIKGGLKEFAKVAGLAPDEILFRSSAPNYKNNDKDQKITPETIAAFKEYGITHVINVNREAESQEYKDALKAAGIKYTPIPVKDYSAPTQKDFEKAWDSFKENKPAGTLVHCGFGHGRTGTVVTSIQMRSEHERGILRKWGPADYRKNHVEHETVLKQSTGQDESLEKLQSILKKEGRTAGGQRASIPWLADCYPITQSPAPAPADGDEDAGIIPPPTHPSAKKKPNPNASNDGQGADDDVDEVIVPPPTHPSAKPKPKPNTSNNGQGADDDDVDEVIVPPPTHPSSNKKPKPSTPNGGQRPDDAGEDDDSDGTGTKPKPTKPKPTKPKSGRTRRHFYA
ncbi:hypothetical protein H634G_09597 [Metarhizium anisopliae BRIP 53293]|uniref:Tyrosine specific protein phosphatases domain-containing protein n=1 Tax=Metarhizium anisopliae BRIP 53293 TaxID=1291518 RepID=A0A0D9NRL0_METAN|nr:hypothetical protein H634G_09597 [Metarhizium anisopliae BRIP 53293]KJK85577.1 hypothetical protein H633G_10570 [Metarhizium anisopliae BRIP 53284]